MAEPCCSQIDVAMGGADWKANVQVEDDDVRHCSPSTKKQRARRGDVSLTVFISGVVVLEMLGELVVGKLVNLWENSLACYWVSSS